MHIIHTYNTHSIQAWRTYLHDFEEYQKYVVFGACIDFGTCYMRLRASKNRSSIVPSPENIQNTSILTFQGSQINIFQTNVKHQFCEMLSYVKKYADFGDTCNFAWNLLFVYDFHFYATKVRRNFASKIVIPNKRNTAIWKTAWVRHVSVMCFSCARHVPAAVCGHGCHFHNLYIIPVSRLQTARRQILYFDV